MSEVKFEKERVFSIDHVSQEDGERYTGSFTAYRPNIGALSRIGSIKALLNGSPNVDANTDALNEMIATCEVLIDPKTAPKWWNPRELFDVEILGKVYQEANKFSTFRGRGLDGSSTKESTQSSKEPGTIGSATKVVDI